MKLNLVLLALASCIRVFGADSAVIKVGLALNFSNLTDNSYNVFGSPARNGAKLAIEEVNRELASKNVSLALEEFDFGADKLNVAKTAKAAVVSGAIAVVGYEYSDEALLAAPVHIEAKVPMLALSATADRLGDFPNYVHPLSFNNSRQAKVLSSVAVQKLKAKTGLLIVARDCSSCTDLSEAFIRHFEKGGGKIIKNLPILKDTKDFALIASQVLERKPDFVFLAVSEIGAGRIIVSLLEKGYRKPFLGPDSLRNLGGQVFDTPNSKYFKGWMTAHWNLASKGSHSEEFVKNYRKTYQKDPSGSAALGYDALKLIGEKIKILSEYTSAALEGELSRPYSFEGVAGTSRFKGNKAPEKTILLLKSTPKRFEVNKILDPE